jgi:hypothetical protein
MKTSASIICGCGQTVVVEAVGTRVAQEDLCPNCHAVLWFVEPLGNFAGQLIISRAWNELKNGDWTLTIVLGAMAVECEMARLYLKWNEIDLLNTRPANDADREEWEERWRKFSAVGTKLDKVSELLTGQPFDSFLSQNSGLLRAARARYRAITASPSPRKYFEDEFFKRRNRIMHRGEIDFPQADAELCFTIAATLLGILTEMDEQRQRALNAKHKARLRRLP